MKVIIFLLSIVLIMIGCGDKGPTKPIVDNPKEHTPQIFDISPKEGVSGSIVRITGNNFGNLPANGNIMLNDLRLKIITWGDSTINCGILPNSKTGKLKVVVNTVSSNEFDFKVTTRPEFVLINKLYWCTSNLDVSKYRNGDTIPHIKSSHEWSQLTIGAWCYYNNDSVLGRYYGKIYNWYAVSDPRGLAPTGFRIPTFAEWSQFIYNLGGMDTAGGNLKEKNTWHWKYPNAMATNESGFSALGGGLRQQLGTFSLIEEEGAFWTSSSPDNIVANACFIHYFNGGLDFDRMNKKVGYYVRCVKEK